MFPIVFAAISGRSMKMIARYLAEKGTKISVCVFLSSSPTLLAQASLGLHRMLNIATDLGVTHGQPICLGHG